MDNKKTIDVLNAIIQINNDRIEGYETASKETEEVDLKTLFAGFIDTSEQCKEDLEDEVQKLGGEATESTRITGKFFRVWMDVKAALTGNDRKAILNSCEYGEQAAQDTYEKVLTDDLENISAEQQTMLAAQKNLLKADQNKIISLRDALVESN
jgi:uncharacterized protein (TIGR02284 family)